VTGTDLWHDEVGKNTEAKFDETYPGMITTPQAQPDHMWLSEAEWKSLMPANPRKNDMVPVPASLADRLVRRHLSPLSVYGETEPRQRREMGPLELDLRVDDVSPRLVRLRLNGHAVLGTEAPAGVTDGGRACINEWGYKPQLLGFLEYDPQARVFNRFDVV